MSQAVSFGVKRRLGVISGRRRVTAVSRIRGTRRMREYVTLCRLGTVRPRVQIPGPRPKSDSTAAHDAGRISAAVEGRNGLAIVRELADELSPVASRG